MYLLKKALTLLRWNILGGAGDICVCPVIESSYFTRAIYLNSYVVMSPRGGLRLPSRLAATTHRYPGGRDTFVTTP